MAEPFIAEIRLFSFNLVPRGWAICAGQTLPVNQNQALFALLGTTYGGNGSTTFQLPNLQGRIPVGFNTGTVGAIGTAGGEENHTLTTGEMPVHTHGMTGSSATAAGGVDAASAYPAVTTMPTYAASANTTLGPGSSGGGGGQGHPNQPPYLGLAYCIALTGIFPSRQ